MQILTIRTGFVVFECKFEPAERDSKHLNPNLNHWKGIQSIRMRMLTILTGLEGFECSFQSFERDSKHLNTNSNHSKGFEALECKLKPFERD